MFLKSFFTFLLFPSLLWAHSWYPAECCSDKDCKPVPCQEIIAQPDGTFIYNGIKFTKEMVKASQDGFCHVCNEGLRAFCVFFPGSV